MDLRDLLSFERVIPRIGARDKRGALRKLAAHAARDVGVPKSTIVRLVLELIDLPVIELAPGISLPHAFVDGLSHPIATFAGLEPAVDFGSEDGSNTDLIMLLLSPVKSNGDHLRVLACIARTLRDPKVHELLRATSCRDAMYVALCGSQNEQVKQSAVEGFSTG